MKRGAVVRDLSSHPSGTAIAWLLVVAFYYQGILLVAENRSGRDLPDLGLFFALVSGLALIYFRHALSFGRALRRPGVLGWIFMLAWAAVSLWWSPNREYGTMKLIALSILAIAPGALAAHLGIWGETRWSPIAAAGVVFASGVLAFGGFHEDRLTLVGGNPIWVARSCLLAITVALWAPNVSSVLRVVTLGTCGYASLLTGSRGPLISFVVASLGGMIVASTRRHSREAGSSLRRIAKGTLLIALGVVGALGLQPHISEISAASRVASLLEPQRTLAQDAAVAERISLQRVAWDNFLNNPVAGIGAGGNAPLGSVAYPHNIALEIISETGLVGLIIWMWVTVRAIWDAREDRLLFVLLLQALLYAMFSGDLSGNATLVMFTCLSWRTRVHKVSRSAINRPLGVSTLAVDSRPSGSQAGA